MTPHAAGSPGLSPRGQGSASPAWQLGCRHRHNEPLFLFPLLPELFPSHIPARLASSPGLLGLAA